MRMSGARAMIKALESENVDTVFGYPGAAIIPFYDALLDSGVRHILCRNEQGAAHAASGFARATGRTGVCVATSGPGATNLITGIATAYMDSIPLVAITGQVSSELIGSDSFQEVDITGATSPFTKHNYLVKEASDLPRIFKEAFFLAATGRPGPVLIDVPVDIQTSMLDFTYDMEIKLPGYRQKLEITDEEFSELEKMLAEAVNPIICAGGGIISCNASGQLQAVVEKYKLPVVTTMMGIGAIACNHPLYLGTLGSHGVYAANYALHHADLVILVGARVGNRAMGSATEIARRASIVHIDIDPAEIGKNIRPHLPIIADAEKALQKMLQLNINNRWEQWLEKVSELKSRQADWPPKPDKESLINPPYLLKLLGSKAGSAIITTEVGQNQIWAANHYPVHLPRTFISSGGMGTMGYGLPAALGAKMGCPDCQVIAISGDGSLQMSIQELGTIRQEKQAVKIILFNNSRLGMVHELQSMKYRRYSQVFLEENPDFQIVAEAYGFEHAKIDRNEDIDQALDIMLKADKPYLLECVVDPHEPTLYPLRKD